MFLSFTGFASFSPKQETFQYSNISPRTSIDSQGHLTPASRSPDVAPVAKPKKFFKSRNAAPETDITTASSSSIHDQHNTMTFPGGIPIIPPINSADKKISIKINKKLLDKPRKPKAEKVKVEKVKVEKVKVEKVKVEKVKVVKPKAVKKKEKIDTKPVKTPEQPTRVLGRARKTINYSEDRSRSPTPVRSRTAAVDFVDPIVASTPIQHEPQSETDVSGNSGVEEPKDLQQKVLFSPESPSKNAEHPPIVLRISKVR